MKPVLAPRTLSFSRIEPLESRIAPAVFLVTNLNDSGPGSLRDMISQANAQPGADEIHFSKSGVIHLASTEPQITESLTIEGLSKVTIDGVKKYQLLDIEGTGIDVKIAGLKLINGVGALTTDPDITKVSSGGAIRIHDPAGTVLIQRCVLTGNSAGFSSNVDGQIVAYDGQGGAITNEAGTVTIQSSTITSNKAVGALNANGGAIFNAAGATLTVTGSTISNNIAQGISKNGADGLKGNAGSKGLKGEAGGSGEQGGDAENGTNGGEAKGGGVYNLGTLSIIEKSVISNNSAKGGNGGNGGKGGAGGNGGAGGAGYTIPASYGSPSYHHDAGLPGLGGYGGLGGSAGNGGSAEGGGIFSGDSGSLTIQNSSLTGNLAQAGLAGKGGSGGKSGSGLLGPGTPVASGLNGIEGDHSAGGAIWNGGILKIQNNSGVSKNSVVGGDASGGGIYNGQVAILTLENSTVAMNSAKASSGANGAAGAKGVNGLAGARGASGSPQSGEDGEPGGDGDAGGSGGNGENGGLGRDALGGGIINFGTTTIRASIVSGNTVTAGSGGNAGNGGNGGAGGAGGRGGAGGSGYSSYGYITPAGHAGPNGIAGLGGAGGNGGRGGSAGSALGAGIFNAPDLNSGDPNETQGAASVTIENTTISANITKIGAFGKAGAAGKAGSGRAPQAGETATAINGAAGVAGVAGDGSGGGVFSREGSLVITQSTIALNKAMGNGGGVAVDQNTLTKIHNSTVALNSADHSGGGLSVKLNPTPDPVEVISTIIALNKAATNKDVNGAIAATFSLIQSVGTATIDTASNIFGQDPKLGPLGSFGGPTPTMVPKPTSPALNFGSNPDLLGVDQRGLSRITGTAIDIGAAEFAPK